MNNEVLAIYKDKLLDTLEAFDSFCNLHNLEYSACAGSALGAVRHNNIIPWDDDIDVFMPRKDYDVFTSLGPELSKGKYRIAKLGDDNYIYSFAKFYDATTTVIEYKNYPRCVTGVWVDIFPLDEEYRNFEDTFSKKEEYMNLYRKFQYTYFQPSLYNIAYYVKDKKYSVLCDILYSFLSTRKKKEKIRKDFISYDKEWRGEGGDMLLCHVGMYPLKKELFPKSWLKETKYLPFGKTRIRVMADYHKYLTNLFGDYMTPPPVEQQVSHHYYYYLNLKEGLSLSQVKERILKGERLVY